MDIGLYWRTYFYSSEGKQMIKKIEEVLENCDYKVSKDRVDEDICRLDCLPCQVVIDIGQCLALIELFRDIEK